MGEGETVGSVCEWEGEGLCVCVCEGDYVGVGGVECEMSVRWGISPHDQLYPSSSVNFACVGKRLRPHTQPVVE